MRDFKTILKLERKRAGLTQHQLAEASGISYSYLTKLENGAQSNPTRETMSRLSEALGVPLEARWIFSDAIATPESEELHAKIEQLNDKGVEQATNFVDLLLKTEEFRRWAL